MLILRKASMRPVYSLSAGGLNEPSMVVHFHAVRFWHMQLNSVNQPHSPQLSTLTLLDEHPSLTR